MFGKRRYVTCKPSQSNLFLQVLDDWFRPWRGATPIQAQWYRNCWFFLFGMRCVFRWCPRQFVWDGLCYHHQMYVLHEDIVTQMFEKEEWFNKPLSPRTLKKMTKLLINESHEQQLS